MLGCPRTVPSFDPSHHRDGSDDAGIQLEVRAVLGDAARLLLGHVHRVHRRLDQARFHHEVQRDSYRCLQRIHNQLSLWRYTNQAKTRFLGPFRFSRSTDGIHSLSTRSCSRQIALSFALVHERWIHRAFHRRLLVPLHMSCSQHNLHSWESLRHYAEASRREDCGEVVDSSSRFDHQNEADSYQWKSWLRNFADAQNANFKVPIPAISSHHIVNTKPC